MFKYEQKEPIPFINYESHVEGRILSSRLVQSHKHSCCFIIDNDQSYKIANELSS
jgi:hypothetical protein